MYTGMIEIRSLKILLKSFHENYGDLIKKQHSIFDEECLNIPRTQFV